MKRNMKRICCLLLLVCMLVTLVPVHAAEEKTVVDFVLVLDCSGTMLRNDPNQLAATACKSFMDLLPIMNARVGVITFGYSGGGFDYHAFNVTYDKNLIHQISPLKGSMTYEQKAALQNKITAAAKKDGQNTPVGQALAAAVDTLISGGSTDGNACVILLSDGGLSSPVAFQESINLVDEAAKKAKSHKWPIYCIELDYKNSNETTTKENRTRLNRICELSGSGKDGRVKVSSPEDVWDAFWKIFEKFGNPQDPNHEGFVIGPDGTVEQPITVPDLCSETNVIIYSDAVDAVELVNKAKNTSVKFTKSQHDEKYIVTVDPEYFSVKVVCPEAGDWIVRVHGDKNAKVDSYSWHFFEMDLKLVASPDGSQRVNKNDTIKFQSYFNYGAVNYTNTPFYSQIPASLVVTSESGAVKEYEMSGETNGYHVELPVADIPTGKFTAQVVLYYDRFRNGKTVSNPITFHSENLPLTLRADAGEITCTGYLNSTFDALDLSKVFDNPDGDPVTYELVCTSDSTVIFEGTPDQNNANVLHIPTGVVPGTYQMQVEAKDPDMTEPLVYTGLTLVVENQGLEVVKELEPQKVWVDYYDNFFIRQDVGNTVLDIDLNEYFSDPDGLELTFSDVTTDVDGILDVGISGGKLYGEPLEKGEVVLKGTVSETVDSMDYEIRIEVVSGKSEYWRTHLIYYIMALAAIVIAVLVWLYIKSKTRMKGSWMVTITKGFNSITSEVGMPARSMSTVKKAKSKPFLMKNLVNEYTAFMGDQGDLKNQLVRFLDTPAGKTIKFKGIFNGIGFVVMDIPTGEDVEIEYNNQLKTGVKKFRVSGGELRVTLKCSNDMGISESMSIYFKNTGK